MWYGASTCSEIESVLIPKWEHVVAPIATIELAVKTLGANGAMAGRASEQMLAFERGAHFAHPIVGPGAIGAQKIGHAMILNGAQHVFTMQLPAVITIRVLGAHGRG